MGGCFLGCFKSFSKETKKSYHRKIKFLPHNQRNGSYEPLQSGVYPKSDTYANPGNQILLVKEDKHEEQSSLSIKKNNSLDAVKAQPVPIDHKDKHEEQSSLSVKKNNLFDAVKAQPVPIEEAMLEEQPKLRIRKKVNFDANVKTYEPVLVIESTEVLAEFIQDNEKQKEELSEKPHLPCYPINHRYNNCQESDEEVDELESQESYSDDEDSEYAEDDYNETVEELSCLDMREKKTVGEGKCGQARGVYIHPTLNPVENLDEWNSLKTKIKTQTKTKTKTKVIEDQHREVAVDASLSSWLVSPEATFKKSTYDGFEPISQKTSTEDRSILGALTVEEEKETRGSMSDEMLMTNSIGTSRNYTWPQVKDIGAAFSYKRLPNVTNKYQEMVSC